MTETTSNDLRPSQISSLLRDRDFDGIGNVEGVDIHRRFSGDRDNDPDCQLYVLRYFFPDSNPYTILRNFENHFEQILNLEPEALVVYRIDGRITHMGRAIKDKLVISKFGQAHAYLHPVLTVPSEYLDSSQDVRFYRKIS